MSTWTYLLRPDNGKVFCVIDIHLWRESSRVTQGFSESKTFEFCSRPLTKEESHDYANHMRLYSCSYETFDTLYEDETRIAGEEFAKKIKECYEKSTRCSRGTLKPK